MSTPYPQPTHRVLQGDLPFVMDPRAATLHHLAAGDDGRWNCRLSFQIPLVSLSGQSRNFIWVVYLDCTVNAAWHRNEGLAPAYTMTPAASVSSTAPAASSSADPAPTTGHIWDA